MPNEWAPPAPIRAVAIAIDIALAFSFSRKPRDTERICTRPRQRVEPIHTDTSPTGNILLSISLIRFIVIFVWTAEVRLGATPSRPYLCRRVAFPTSDGIRRQCTHNRVQVYARYVSIGYVTLRYVMFYAARRGNSWKRKQLAREGPRVFAGQRSFQMVNSEQIWE